MYPKATYMVVLARGNDERHYYPEVRDTTEPMNKIRAVNAAMIDWREEFEHNSTNGIRVVSITRKEG